MGISLGISRLTAAIIAIACVALFAIRIGTAAGPTAGDTTADRVLGQPDFFHRAPNSVDA